MGFLTNPNTAGPAAHLPIKEQVFEDLMLDEYLGELFRIDVNKRAKTLDYASLITSDPNEILFRREVLQDLSDNPELVSRIREVCSCLNQIQAYASMPTSGEFIGEGVREFSVLELSYTSMSQLSALLESLKAQGKLRASGLLTLSEVMKEKVAQNFTKDFPSLWPGFSGGLNELGSLRIRFTLDDELKAEGAAITHVQREKFTRGGLSAHAVRAEDRQKDHPWDLAPLKEMKTPAEELVRVQIANNQKAFLQTMENLMGDLEDLYQDLRFYLGALRYIRQLQEFGIPLCYPEILPMQQKAFSAEGLENPILSSFKKGKTVPNDITFEEGGEMLILTGINQGGKTTFLRAVGVAQVLFQLGWPVAAAKASISPVDNIVTVFSHEENTNLQHGKLGQELKTLRSGLDEATPYCLLLCNEPITGTSPMENLYLSREVLCAVKLKGYHGIWVTHIYDLASGAKEMNQLLPGSKISSIIAVATGQGENVEASFHIERGEPQFTSYAKEVLRKETGVF